MSTHADTLKPFGAPTLTIDAVTYIVADTFKVDRGSNVVKTTDGAGAEDGSFGLFTVPTGSATLQKAASATKQPPVGETFTYTDDATIGSETWILTKVGSARPSGAVHTFDIEFIKQMN